jgi:hypothetical protein
VLSISALGNSIHGDCDNEPEEILSQQAEDKTNPTNFSVDHQEWHGSSEHIERFILNQKSSKWAKTG